MTPTQRKAMEQALDWFDWLHSGQPDHMAGIDTDGVRQSLRNALAEPQGEPVAWLVTADGEDHKVFLNRESARMWCADEKHRGAPYVFECKPLYTAPQPAKQEPLTDEELGKIINANWGVGVWQMARAIEAAHGITGETK